MDYGMLQKRFQNMHVVNWLKSQLGIMEIWQHWTEVDN